MALGAHKVGGMKAVRVWVLVLVAGGWVGWLALERGAPPQPRLDDRVSLFELAKRGHGHGRKKSSRSTRRSGETGGANAGRPVETFEAAHKVLPQIFGENPRTIYCGCQVHGNKIDLASCGYRVHKDRKRALRREWEHVVPAHAFGHSFVEWREGAPACPRKGKKSRGRSCARTNRDFNLMESDLYNLWPEVGELNGLRNNFSMAEISGRAMTFGGCGAKIADKKFEPMDMAKGTVARVYMYMDGKYPGRGIISEKNRKLFEAWDKQHPVAESECEIGRKVLAIQHNPNPILAARCKGWPSPTPAP
jgi:deoxyribonuclease-1